MANQNNRRCPRNRHTASSASTKPSSKSVVVADAVPITTLRSRRPKPSADRDEVAGRHGTRSGKDGDTRPRDLRPPHLIVEARASPDAHRAGRLKSTNNLKGTHMTNIDPNTMRSLRGPRPRQRLC